jgi:diaminopimelate decarboxylase
MLAKTPAKLNFGHPPATLEFWKRLAREALSHSTPTPCYIFSALPIAEKIAELDQSLAAAGFQSAIGNRQSKIICRHWLSCKTQPVAPLLRWWRGQGRPIEVVSEFELRAALAEGFAPQDILINGPAKHHWLTQFDGTAGADPAHLADQLKRTGAEACLGVDASVPSQVPRAGAVPGAPRLRELAVNFDSPTELAALLPLAQKWNWRCGVRLNTREEFDPENPQFPTQFGFTPEEAVTALKKLRRAGARVETLSFHLRTNIPSAQIYQRALAEMAEVCRAAKFAPQVLDLGGGLPVRQVLTRGGKVFDGEFGLRAFAKMLQQSVKAFPGVRELWLENGRFVSAGSGVLVVKILDVKERRGLRQLICDGGRTLNALTSLWEQHRILPLPHRSGASVLTAVHGPTCMAFDQLARVPLPRSLRAGDHLVWLDAGAYHIPWETRFSHGHAAVWWHDERGLQVVREPQSFQDFWGQWRRGESPVKTTRAPGRSGLRIQAA